MKNFATPIIVKCANIEEMRLCKDILVDNGYSEIRESDSNLNVFTQFAGINNLFSSFSGDIPVGKHPKYYIIENFNKDLVRDISAICNDDIWQKNEPCISSAHVYSPIGRDVGSSVSCTTCRRATIPEVCKIYGYVICDNCVIKIDQEYIKNKREEVLMRLAKLQKTIDCWSLTIDEIKKLL